MLYNISIINRWLHIIMRGWNVSVVNINGVFFIEMKLIKEDKVYSLYKKVTKR